MGREEIVNDLISNIYELEGGKLSFKGGKSKLLVYIKSLHSKQTHKYLGVVRDKGELDRHFMLSLYWCFNKADDLKEYNYYEEDIRELGSLCSYIKKRLPFEMQRILNEEDGTKRIRVSGDKVNVKMEYSSLDYEGYGEPITNSLSEDSNYLNYKDTKESNKNNQRFKELMCVSLTDYQQRYYNNIKEDFELDTDVLKDNGYINFEEYIRDKGYGRASYYRFKERVKDKLGSIYEGGDGMIREGAELYEELSKIIYALESEDMTKKEIEFYISKVIASNYEDKSFYEVIVEGLNTEDKVGLVRLVKTMEGLLVKFKGGEVIGDDNVNYLDNKTMYKVVNNVYEHIEKEDNKYEEEVKRESKEEVVKRVIHPESVRAFNLTPYGYVESQRHTR